jgi:hypothetical protein
MVPALRTPFSPTQVHLTECSSTTDESARASLNPPEFGSATCLRSSLTTPTSILPQGPLVHSGLYGTQARPGVVGESVRLKFAGGSISPHAMTREPAGSTPTKYAPHGHVFSMPFLPYSPYYQPSICSNDGAVTLARPSHSLCYGLDFTYTPSAAPHLRGTFKGKGHQLKLLGREISRGLRHNLPAPDTDYSGQKEKHRVGSGRRRSREQAFRRVQ